MLHSIFTIITLSAAYLIFVIPAFAQCPVCIVTVGGGMFLAQKLGIDDLLISIWISALNVAITFWMAPKIKIRVLKNPYFLSLLVMAFTLFYFQFTDQIGGPTNRIFGVDKIILGQFIGILSMYLGNFLYLYSKKQNHPRTIFPYAKVVFPLAATIISTLFFKLIFRL